MLMISGSGKNSEGGVTFTEVLIALGILGFVFAGIFSAILGNGALNSANGNTLLALSHAEYVLEQIRATPYEAIEGLIVRGRWTMKAEAFAKEGLTPLRAEEVATSVRGNGPLTVNVLVEWQDTSGHKRRIELSTIEAGL